MSDRDCALHHSPWNKGLKGLLYAIHLKLNHLDAAHSWCFLTLNHSECHKAEFWHLNDLQNSYRPQQRAGLCLSELINNWSRASSGKPAGDRILCRSKADSHRLAKVHAQRGVGVRRERSTKLPVELVSGRWKDATDWNMWKLQQNHQELFLHGLDSKTQLSF